MALAQAMAAGLAANPLVYPAPPVAPVDLSLSITSFGTAMTDAVAAQAAAEAAVTAKDEALQAMVDDMKADLRYAEMTVDFDDDQLKLIGWGGRACRDIAGGSRSGAARSKRRNRARVWIFLDWKAPDDGGAVAAYKIQRRLRPDGPWGDVGMAMETEVTLSDQTRGSEWEYRVVAVNKAGEGLPSNTVMAVL